jgi:hypothetical protein
MSEPIYPSRAHPPIVTTEAVTKATATEQREWTYDEILELWSDDANCLVVQLVLRCQQYERQIEILRDGLCWIHNRANNTLTQARAREHTHVD